MKSGREEDRKWLDLPSEQDRKATLGCLAAVLNMMYSYECRTFTDESKKTLERASQRQRDGIVRTVSDFALRQDSSWIDTSPNIRRKEFQIEMLYMSAELLFLPVDCAAVFVPNLDIVCSSDENEEQVLLEPFLQSFSKADAAFRCISLLLFRFLLVSSTNPDPGNSGGGTQKMNDKEARSNTIVGYDARVRYAFKAMAVAVISYCHSPQTSFAVGDGPETNEQSGRKNESRERDSIRTASEAIRQKSMRRYSTRKFEALEDDIAERLRYISKWVEEKKDNSKNSDSSLKGSFQRRSIGQHLARGLKIGGAGVAAGTLFAITGGLAAPAIVTSVAALTGAGIAGTAAIALVTFPATVTLFGIGGGTLVAGKMSKRTKGLSDFEIERVIPGNDERCDRESIKDGSRGQGYKSSQPTSLAELSRTVCISGWLTDEHDFQRPFGITPGTLTDKHELLCRFCSVYSPNVLPKCRWIIQQWEGREEELWEMLLTTYGKDPGSLLPLLGPRQEATLSGEENEAVDDLVRILGFPIPPQSQDDLPTSLQQGSSRKFNLPPPVNLLADILANSHDDSAADDNMSETTIRSYKAWDFRAQYGGEQYIVSWEKTLLLQLNGSANEFTAGLAKTAAEEVLKKTAIRSLMTAVALPSTMLALSNLIDEKWTLVAERADEAGVVLAQSLLNSDAGHRPVSLVGFSFGARIISSCLEELSRHQVLWERQQSGEDGRRGLVGWSSWKIDSLAYSREPASIVEDAILMGCPAIVTPSAWSMCRRVVGGRLVNCYSRNDWMLALIYRIKNLTSSSPAGIVEAKVAGVENYEVSEVVASHAEYCVAVNQILDIVGYDQPRS